MSDRQCRITLVWKKPIRFFLWSVNCWWNKMEECSSVFVFVGTVGVHGGGGCWSWDSRLLICRLFTCESWPRGEALLWGKEPSSPACRGGWAGIRCKHPEVSQTGGTPWRGQSETLKIWSCVQRFHVGEFQHLWGYWTFWFGKYIVLLAGMHNKLSV